MAKDYVTPLVIKGDGPQTGLTVEGTTPDGPGSIALVDVGGAEIRVTGPTSLAVGQGAAMDQVGDLMNVAFGPQALAHSASWRSTAVGYNAGANNAGHGACLVGENAGLNNRGIQVSAFGVTTAENNSGSNVAAMGAMAAKDNTGSGLVAVGYKAGESNTGAGVVAIGESAQDKGTTDNVVVIGAHANATAPNTVQLGDNTKAFTLGIGNSGYGTAGQVLRVNDAGNGMEWVPASPRITDANAVKTAGEYQGYNVANAADATAISTFHVEQYSGDWGMQIQTRIADGVQWRRFWRSSGGVWSAWTIMGNPSAWFNGNTKTLTAGANTVDTLAGAPVHVSPGWDSCYSLSSGLLVTKYAGMYMASYTAIFPKVGGGDTYYLNGSQIFRSAANGTLSGRIYISTVTSTVTRVSSWLYSSTSGNIGTCNSYSGFPNQVNSASFQVQVTRLSDA